MDYEYRSLVKELNETNRLIAQAIYAIQGYVRSGELPATELKVGMFIIPRKGKIREIESVKIETDWDLVEAFKFRNGHTNTWQDMADLQSYNPQAVFLGFGDFEIKINEKCIFSVFERIWS